MGSVKTENSAIGPRMDDLVDLRDFLFNLFQGCFRGRLFDRTHVASSWNIESWNIELWNVDSWNGFLSKRPFFIRSTGAEYQIPVE